MPNFAAIEITITSRIRNSDIDRMSEFFFVLLSMKQNNN